jgi:adenosylmethionine-8-amino-7-oxononanoate aminotransferase
MKCDTRDELLAWDRQLVWHPFTQMAEYEPLVFARGDGCYLFDLDGRGYLDGVSSLWCNVHGHRHPTIDAAIRRQLEEVAHTTLLGASNPTTVRLARRLVDLAPAGLEHVFFSDNGATAVEVAIKMAFQYWRQTSHPRPEKTRYVALGDAYHGDTLGAVSVGGVERFRAMFEPLLFHVDRLPVPDATRTPPGVERERLAAWHLERLENYLDRHHHQVAAMVVEPLVQAAAGMVMHPPGYLRGVRELTRRYDVLLVADEVAVGMGRTGTMFACQQEHVSPDLLCLAKGLSGGYLPLAATLATGRIHQAFLGESSEQKTFCHGHTYGGNPLGAAAALASMEIFCAEETLVALPDKIARLGRHLDRLAEHPHVRSARQCGMIAAVELVCEKNTDEPYPWQQQRAWRVCRHALREGVFLRPLRDVVVIMPPLAVTWQQIDQIMHAVGRSVETATRE